MGKPGDKTPEQIAEMDKIVEMVMRENGIQEPFPSGHAELTYEIDEDPTAYAE